MEDAPAQAESLPRISVGAIADRADRTSTSLTGTYAPPPFGVKRVQFIFYDPMAPAPVPVVDQPGPHPSYIQVAKPFIFEQRLQSHIIATGANRAREDSIRLQGVTWIDEVRKALGL
jgi:hypothetical protein